VADNEEIFASVLAGLAEGFNEGIKGLRERRKEQSEMELKARAVGIEEEKELREDEKFVVTTGLKRAEMEQEAALKREEMASQERREAAKTRAWLLKHGIKAAGQELSAPEINQLQVADEGVRNLSSEIADDIAKLHESVDSPAGASNESAFMSAARSPDPAIRALAAGIQAKIASKKNKEKVIKILQLKGRIPQDPAPTRHAPTSLQEPAQEDPSIFSKLIDKFSEVAKSRAEQRARPGAAFLERTAAERKKKTAEAAEEAAKAEIYARQPRPGKQR